MLFCQAKYIRISGEVSRMSLEHISMKWMEWLSWTIKFSKYASIALSTIEIVRLKEKLMLTLDLQDQ